MDCRQVEAHIEELLDEALAEPLHSAVQAHLNHCRRCQDMVAQERALREVLQSLPVPPPTPGFHDRVLRNATARRSAGQRNLLIGMALAASLVIGVALGLMIAPSAPVGDAGIQAVAFALEQPREVRLAFESGQALKDVTLTVRLPDAVELVGYPGQRELSWRTDLQRGRNELTLPLVVRGGAGGMLVTELGHGDLRKHFSVRIKVADEVGAALRPSPLTI